MGFNWAFKGLMGTVGHPPGIRQPGCEVNHSTPTSAEVQNG